MAVSGSAPEPTFAPGDFLLTRRRSWPSRLIALGQRIRFRGARRQYARWTHAALVVSTDGQLVEALARGVERTHIGHYADVPHRVVSVPMADLDRAEVLAYAVRAVGRRYGWLEILSLGLELLTGSVISFGVDSQVICSGLVASALSRTDALFPRDPARMRPADLAEYYRVS